MGQIKTKAAAVLEARPEDVYAPSIYRKELKLLETVAQKRETPVTGPNQK